MIAGSTFGRTGHTSSRVIFGAAALGGMSQERADEILPTLLEFGVNHIDTAAAYGDSELRIGPWMEHHRDDFFLATKTGDRGGAAARASLERSLARLRTDRVDLIQLHNLVEDDEWEAAFAPDGAVAALAAARDEGLVRFVGVTGHGTRIPGMHLRSLERFDFDSVLLPYNFTMMQRADYAPDVERLLAVCSDRGVAVQTIKSVARRRWAPEVERRFSWYEPITDADAIGRAVWFVLGREQLFLNTSSDARLLRTALVAAAAAADAGGSATVPTDEEMAADVAAHGIRALFDGGDLERI